MTEIFRNILTIIGQQKKATAEAGGTPVNITHFEVGDGNGAYYEPLETQTALLHSVYASYFGAGSQSQIIINPKAANEVLYKCYIPADVGGFTIRELGLFDANNDLILICKIPAQEKFALDTGIYQPLTLTPKIIYTNTKEHAVLTVSSQVVATQESINAHLTDLTAHSLLFNSKINKSGDTMSGYLSIPNGTSNSHAINKSQLDSAQSSLQAQIDTKQTILTGAATTIDTENLAASRILISDANGKIAASTISQSYLSYIDVTSSIQTQLNSKQTTITGAASSILTNNLTANMALISDANGKITASSVISTAKLGYLDGVTSEIQSQINSKAPVAGSSSQAFSVANATTSNHAVNKGQFDLIAIKNIWISNEYIPVLSTATIINHNLNLNPLHAKGEVLLKCINPEAGYIAGDLVSLWSSPSVWRDIGVNPVSPVILAANTIQTVTGCHYSGLSIVHKSSGNLIEINLANWRYIFRIWY